MVNNQIGIISENEKKNQNRVNAEKMTKTGKIMIRICMNTIRFL